jgi:phage-related minor tail protein
MGLASLITALHARPFQLFPMTFAPILAFSSYLNLGGFVVDSAGLTAAWSGLYMLLALRRRQASLKSRFTARGAVRGAAIGLGAANLVSGGYVWATGDRKKEEEERKKRDRWGVYGAKNNS